jgi:peroxiredoxin
MVNLLCLMDTNLLSHGTKAPQFSLPVTPAKKLSLTDFRGKPLILAFYPADWSPVCGNELSLFNEVLDEFKKYGAELLGISVDHVWSHAAYKQAKKLRFELLSDFEPKGETAKRFGAYREKEGVCERALFLIDGEGVIQWSYLSPIEVNPGADGLLDALDKMTRDELKSDPSSGTSTDISKRAAS